MLNGGECHTVMLIAGCCWGRVRWTGTDLVSTRGGGGHCIICWVHLRLMDLGILVSPLGVRCRSKHPVMIVDGDCIDFVYSQEDGHILQATVTNRYIWLKTQRPVFRVTFNYIRCGKCVSLGQNTTGDDNRFITMQTKYVIVATIIVAGSVYKTCCISWRAVGIV